MLAIQKNLSRSFFVLLSLPVTAMGLALSIQIATLSWFLGTEFGLDIHEIGIVWSAGPLSGIIGQIVIGLLSDKVWFWNGRRRPFILIGGFLASMALLALPNIGIISSELGVDGIIAIAIAVALTLDLSINVSFNPTRSIIADVTPEGHDRTRGYTWMQSISGTFAVGAYAVGALWDNYVLIYSGAVVVFLFSMVPTFFITEPRELAAETTEEAPPLSFMRILLSIKTLWGFLLYDIYWAVKTVLGIKTDHYYVEIFCLLLTLFLFFSVNRQTDAKAEKLNEFNKIIAAHAFTWVGVFTLMVYLAPYVEFRMPGLMATEDGKLLQGQIINMAFLVLNAVSAVIPALLLEPLARHFGRIRTHISCLVFLSLAFVGFYLRGQQEVELYVLMFFAGFGWAATISLPFAIMSEKVEKGRMGLFMGLFNLSVVLPQLVVTLSFGLFMSEMADKSMIFLVSSAAIALSIILWSFVKRADQLTVAEA